MFPKSLIFFCSTFGFSGFAYSSDSAEESAPPNVLFIISDDLNTALSGYGHPQVNTPNLDKLAESGVSFTNAYCQFPLCGPSRASLFSGLYPEKTGILKNNVSLADEIVSLPQHFADHGYWSARVGKIYHMDIPHDVIMGTDGADHAPSWDEKHNIRSLETFHPGLVSNVTAPPTVQLYPELRDQWDQDTLNLKAVKQLRGQHSWVIVQSTERDEELADSLATDKAISILKERAEDKQPFFLAVGLVRPHFPFVAPKADFDDYPVEAMEIPEVLPGQLENVPPQALSRDLKIGQRERQEILQAYYACITYMDRQVGRLVESVDQLGLRDNTIIVFVSDHGYLLGEHLSWKKKLLWEEATRVPLIISAPGMENPGKHSDHLVELVDLYPTLTALANLPEQSAVQGLNLEPLLSDPTDGTLERKDAFTQTATSYGLRQGKWAYMWYPKVRKNPEGFTLYDMEKDPNQRYNLATNPEFDPIRSDLHVRLLERIDLAKK
ncbi:MAG: sulfatase [Verrucomicrobiota bacterium]